MNVQRVAVVGAGIFGTTIAYRLCKSIEVDLFEEKEDILQCASFVNQFRLHRGYHYPRSLDTSKVSLNSSKGFEEEYPNSIVKDTKNIYCISKKDSLTSSDDFLEYCDLLGLKYKEVSTPHVNEDKVSLCVEVEEYLIDYNNLKRQVSKRLQHKNIKLHLKTKVTRSMLENYEKVVVCTYSKTNELLPTRYQRDYQHELCEKILVSMPKSFGKTSIVILDGPFMCIDPYGKTENYLLGNVVHAIHSSNIGKEPHIPKRFRKLLNNGFIKNPPITNFDRFISSGSRYIPELSEAKHIASMYTFRTILPYKEETDERPTIVDPINEKFISVFSGKIAHCMDASIEIESLLT